MFWGLKSQARNNLLHRLDAEAYSSEDVVVLTLPLTLPYPIHEGGYERASGEFEYQGEFYHLVKQKLEHDTLFIVCVKDHQQKKLVHALNEYANLANNLPTSAKDSTDMLAKLFKDFTIADFTILHSERGWSLNFPFVENNNFALLQQVYKIDSPPPELS